MGSDGAEARSEPRCSVWRCALTDGAGACQQQRWGVPAEVWHPGAPVQRVLLRFREDRLQQRTVLQPG